MDLLYFATMLWRKRWLILLLTVAAGAATFWLASQKAVFYKSTATMATGIISDLDKGDKEVVFVQEYDVNNRFNNLMEMMRSHTSLAMLSNQLVLHDLTNPKPFRSLDAVKQQFGADTLKSLTAVIERQIARTRQTEPTDSTWLANEKQVEAIAKLLKYDEYQLASTLQINRVTQTDYLRLEFVSESPELSAYVVNHFLEHFIAYYNNVKNLNNTGSLQFLARLVNQKKAEVDGKVQSLKNYKLTENVADLDEETKSLLDQIQQLELAREESNKRIPAYERTLNAYETYATTTEAEFEKLQAANKNIKDLSDQIKQLTDKYISTGRKDTALKKQIDDLNAQREVEIRKTANQIGKGSLPSTKDLAQKGENLWERRLETENELEMARQSVRSMDNEIGRLRGRVSGLVSNEATISTIDREIAMLSDEYLTLVDKLNAAEMRALGSERRSELKVMEPARAADQPEPSGPRHFSRLFGNGDAGAVQFGHFGDGLRRQFVAHAFAISKGGGLAH